MSEQSAPVEHPIVVPRLHGNAEYYQIVAWLKEEGDRIKVGDALLVLETDKAAIEIQATVSGVLEKILVPAGQWAQVGAAVGVVTSPAPNAS